MVHFAGLLDPRIAVVEQPLTGKPPSLEPGEATAVANAVPRRRLEFAVGRDCARRAMMALGHAGSSLPRGDDRAPVWPEALVGSITHTGDWAAAAVARRDQGFIALGIDLEPAEALSPDLWESICTPHERARLSATRNLPPGLAARALFCMKEAAFKCQFPLSGAMLEFADLEIDVDVDAGAFTAEFRTAAPPFKLRDRLAGRFNISAGHVASAVVLMTEHMS